MKPTIVIIDVFYTGDFSRNGGAESDEKIRAGYKRIAFCPGRGCQWQNESENLVQKIRKGFNSVCCPACSRRLRITEVPIFEQSCENEIKGGNKWQRLNFQFHL